jgi:homoserine kinase
VVALLVELVVAAVVLMDVTVVLADVVVEAGGVPKACALGPSTPMPGVGVGTSAAAAVAAVDGLEDADTSNPAATPIFHPPPSVF